MAEAAIRAAMDQDIDLSNKITQLRVSPPGRRQEEAKRKASGELERSSSKQANHLSTPEAFHTPNQRRTPRESSPIAHRRVLHSPEPVRRLDLEEERQSYDWQPPEYLSRTKVPIYLKKPFRDLLTLKQKATRAFLNSEDLRRYLANTLIPNGLRTNIRCHTNLNQELLKSWEETQLNTSRELMSILIEHYVLEHTELKRQVKSESKKFLELCKDDELGLRLLSEMDKNAENLQSRISTKKNSKFEWLKSKATNEPNTNKEATKTNKRRRPNSRSTSRRRQPPQQAAKRSEQPKKRNLESMSKFQLIQMLNQRNTYTRRNNSRGRQAHRRNRYQNNYNNNNNNNNNNIDLYNKKIVESENCNILDFALCPSGIKPNLDLNKTSKNYNFVINLSDKTLSDLQIDTLSKGLNFCPTPGEVNMYELYKDLQKFFRRIRIRDFFNDFEEECTDGIDKDLASFLKTFKPPSKWNPPKSNTIIEGYIETVTQEYLNWLPKKPRKMNLSFKQQTVLKDLAEDPHLIIKKADKGSAVVVMNTIDYVRECYKQLSDNESYTPLTEDPTAKLNEIIQNDLLKMEQEEIIDEKTRIILETPKPRTPYFYILPKIHKKHVPGRPILSANGCITEKISGFVDAHLRKYVPKIPSYIKDTTHFLQILQEVEQPLPRGTILGTLDISSLYTNIPHYEALQAVIKTLQENPEPNLPTKWIITLLRHVLDKNVFQFNGKFFIQKKGTAMGTRVAPSLANIFVYHLMRKALSGYHLKPLVYKRFIDDIFIIWTHGTEEWHKFVDYLNKQHQTIKFTSEFSKTSINFLDTTVKLKNGKLETDLYTKPTDTHSYLHYTSAHPKHCKEHGPFSQLLRIKRICSRTEDYEKHARNLEEFYLKRGYPLRILIKNRLKADSLLRSDLLKPSDKTNKDTNPIPLIVTYNPALPNLSETLRKHWKMLHTSAEMQHLSTPPMIAYRRSRNLKELLVKASLTYPNKQGKSGKIVQNPMEPCQKIRCTICPKLIKKMIFTSSITKRSYKKYDLCYRGDCNTRNVIYLLTCSKCTSQYVGETKRTLCERMKEHLADIRHVRDSPVARHFTSPDHNIDNFSYEIIEIGTRNPDSDTTTSHRREREMYWIHQLKTLFPRGMNNRHDT